MKKKLVDAAPLPGGGAATRCSSSSSNMSTVGKQRAKQRKDGTTIFSNTLVTDTAMGGNNSALSVVGVLCST